ncbi:MAG: outer membrane beta-barrel protein [Oligoflexia bacterium]|nr:outer membrane beta-barrel protein [Oligoflexia bacterium]
MRTTLILLSAIILSAQLALAQGARSGKYTTGAQTSKTLSEEDRSWANEYGPWDFTAFVGFYNPGMGIQGLAAYRLLDSVLPNVDDSLSLESGLGFVSASETLGGQSVSYTAIEFPIQARWDFRIPDTAFMVGPRAGINYLTAGGSTTVNGVTYKSRGSEIYFQAGGHATYRLTEQWWLRTQVMFGSYTSIAVGGSFAL